MKSDTALTRRMRGLARRAFRSHIRTLLRYSRIDRGGGFARLTGYGVSMRYPDRLVWANQFVEIFGDDCYRVATLGGDPIVIDGGANIGTFSCWVKWLRPRARIVAVEPCAANLPLLHENIGGLPGPPVRVIEAGLGDGAVGSVALAGDFSDSMRTVDGGTETVSVVSLADLIGGHVDLLKLDIEGAELAALLSAGVGLQRVRRAVIEYHEYPNRGLRLSTLVSVLETHGFDRFSLSEHREFTWDDPQLPRYCCLLSASRSGR